MIHPAFAQSLEMRKPFRMQAIKRGAEPREAFEQMAQYVAHTERVGQGPPLCFVGGR